MYKHDTRSSTTTSNTSIGAFRTIVSLNTSTHNSYFTILFRFWTIVSWWGISSGISLWCENFSFLYEVQWWGRWIIVPFQLILICESDSRTVKIIFIKLSIVA